VNLGGSIIASLLCVKTDAELPTLFDATTWNLNVYEKRSSGLAGLKRKLDRLRTKGT
jgi:hypothetical protein